jgi:hypothetical protein
MYAWRCQKETLCVAVLNKQKYNFFSFTKSESLRVEQVPPGKGEEVG